MRGKADGYVVAMAGGTFYLIGCAGLIAEWNSTQVIDKLPLVTSCLGFLVACIGVLMMDGYLLFKAIAVIAIAFFLTFGIVWMVFPSVL